MRQTHFRRLAVVTASFLLHLAHALPQAGITIAAAPPVWVTVDASGSAHTVTPAVITTQGHLATISDAPASLVSTATYTLSPSGHASTYTGLAPVASATGTNGSPEGVFPACDSNANVGPVEPFCLPKPGSQLHPGKTYYSALPNPKPTPSQLTPSPFLVNSNLVPNIFLPLHPPAHPLHHLRQHHLRAGLLVLPDPGLAGLLRVVGARGLHRRPRRQRHLHARVRRRQHPRDRGRRRAHGAQRVCHR